MKILIDTSKIKDRYSVYYTSVDDSGDYYNILAAAATNYISRIVSIKGYVTLSECIKHLQDNLGGPKKDNYPLEYSVFGYTNEKDVKIICTPSQDGHHYRFDFLNIEDITPTLVFVGVINHGQIVKEGYYV